MKYVKVSFLNLVLPLVSTEEVPSEVPSEDPSESKMIHAKKKDDVGSGNRRRKGKTKTHQQTTEERSDDNVADIVYKPGQLKM